jgi:ubiquitin thioesterase protein OTUB1
MTSLNNLLVNVGGFDAWVFEDFVEETTNLLKDLAGLIESSPQSAADLLLQRFNDPSISNSIVYHLRLLASSWLKNRTAEYGPFIPAEQGGNIETYSKEWLEPPNQEIDHLGMQLLVDVLLKQIGFAVEVIYLDRSVGSEVNSHLMQAVDANGDPTNPAGPIMHLLYRPGHYDILYKDMDLSLPSQHAVDAAIQNPNLQVQRATSFSHQHNIQSTPMNGFSNGLDFALLSIPGFQCAPSNHGFPPQFQASIERSYSSISASISPISPGTSATPPSTSTNLSLSTNFSPQQASNLASPPLSIPQSSQASFPTQTMQLPIHGGVPQSHVPPHPSRPSLPSHPSLSSQHSDLPSPTSAASPFRPSRFTWDARVADQEGPVVFQTSTFKNSHYNTAHYNNPNFQPEEWSPECEEAVSGPVGGGGRKKSS